jgi:hypothetical protein
LRYIVALSHLLELIARGGFRRKVCARWLLQTRAFLLLSLLLHLCLGRLALGPFGGRALALVSLLLLCGLLFVVGSHCFSGGDMRWVLLREEARNLVSVRADSG